MKYKATLRHVFAALLAVSGTSQGAITLVDTLAVTSTDDLTSYTIDASTLSIIGASKLVVTVGTEGVANTGPNAISSITYAGTALTLAGTGGGNRSNLWYVDLSGKTLVGTDFVLTFSGTNTGYGFGAYALSGTAEGVSSTAVTSTTTLTANPPTAGEFLIASYSRNNAIAAGGDLTELFDQGLESTYQAASLYKQLTASGSQDYSVTGMNGTGATVAATFEAAPIPEPSAALLGGIGLLMLMRRKRA